MVMLAGACGVRPTPILPGSAAPTVSVHEVTVYFGSADGTTLVRRTRSHTGSVDNTTAITTLIEGLTDEEKRLGLRTEVPRTSTPVLTVSNLILLPTDMLPLSKLASYQLFCTALANGAAVNGLPSGVDCP
ncbi:hypothetical protein [Nocardia sp. NRRL S-836]|uniref:hypothetical protein n=1 Tax=Nocardia sp. NRRL S-836 TaxID=1519492 RepID=UPI0006ADE356|nr:hypothetical protein [Nocardia sp. NRRL S-836]KOV84993.1 hypothetical protein ADL03_11580 [Nocardia sp. NRRL S-836]